MKLLTRDVPPRAAWALEQAGVHPLLARLFAARGVSTKDELDDGLNRLLPPSSLKGAAQAAVLLADAIESLLYDTDARASAIASVDRIRSEFTWEEVLRPLVTFCRDPRPAPDRVVDTRSRKRKGQRGARDSIVETTTDDYEADDYARYHRVVSMSPGLIAPKLASACT